jgi:hypothetical protein
MRGVSTACACIGVTRAPPGVAAHTSLGWGFSFPCSVPPRRAVPHPSAGGACGVPRHSLHASQLNAYLLLRALDPKRLRMRFRDRSGLGAQAPMRHVCGVKLLRFAAEECDGLGAQARAGRSLRRLRNLGWGGCGCGDALPLRSGPVPSGEDGRGRVVPERAERDACAG